VKQLFEFLNTFLLKFWIVFWCLMHKFHFRLKLPVSGRSARRRTVHGTMLLLRHVAMRGHVALVADEAITVSAACFVF
jgi:hypothetical protein